MKPARHTVSIDATAYQPLRLTVKVGDSITWVNNDFYPHTVTADAGGFDSKVIPAGKSWEYVPKVPGQFTYHCVYHPTMIGSLKVN